MKVSATRILEFDAGHRVMNHESKCATLHGHRYKAEITAEADELDSVGRVIDFSVLKQRVGEWIDRFWDHTCIIGVADSEVLRALRALPQWKPVYMAAWNPTAENMAWHLLSEVCPNVLQGTGVRVIRVRLWETPNCYCDAVLESAHG